MSISKLEFDILGNMLNLWLRNRWKIDTTLMSVY